MDRSPMRVAHTAPGRGYMPNRAVQLARHAPAYTPLFSGYRRLCRRYALNKYIWGATEGGYMQYIKCYRTPNGFDDLVMCSDGEYLTRLYFNTGNEYVSSPDHASTLFAKTAQWLDSYFSGFPALELPPFQLDGLTPFTRCVLEAVQAIPYGQTCSYGELSSMAAEILGGRRVCPRAAGGAVGRNPLAILIPCHRVISADGSPGGYRWGIENKRRLLLLERSDCRV